MFFLISCGYPDIDTVPDFNDMQITEEEAIELCKIEKTDIVEINNCVEEFLE